MATQNHTETNHMVDQESPEVLALNRFCSAFPYTVDDQDDTCRVFNINHTAIAEAVKNEAAYIIRTYNLPLNVSLSFGKYYGAKLKVFANGNE